MANNRQFDSLQYDQLAMPYNRVERELSSKPRFVRGLNTYVNWGGKIAKRPGVEPLANGSFDRRVDRLWIYETLETPPKVYFVASVFNSGTGRWELWYQRLSSSPGTWTLFTSYRDCNNSTRPHEAVAARGLFYIKSYPASSSSEKLGSIIFDGSSITPSVRPWGMLGPDSPAILGGTSAITSLTATATAGTATFNVVSTAAFPATPFQAQIEFEEVTVTAKAATTFTVTRGTNGTTADAHPTGSSIVFRDFGASDHPVAVNFFWRYSYAYVSITGQVSNRAPEQTNPDLLPSSTGPFKNLVPKISVQGLADTTNFPEIQMLRTTDGGGTWYVLETIPNTGAGTITYLDDSLESGTGGGVFDDPLPDYLLSDFATSIDSNSPPPTVLAPAETGVDTPSNTSPLGYYSGRIWYAIGNVLFYSAQEEIFQGVPEESWPAGLDGNFFRLQYPITNVVGTSNALYVMTLQSIYQVTGTDRNTFAVRPALENIGHPYGHPRAITRFNDKVAILSHDYRIVIIENDDATTVSDPLFTDIVDAISAGAEMDIKYWADLNNEWVFVTAIRAGQTSQTRQWVLDLKRTRERGEPFWFVPWTIPCSSTASGRISELTGQRRMVFFTWDSTNSTGLNTRLDPTGRVAFDTTSQGPQGMTWYFDTNLMENPPGNHVNALRNPLLKSVVNFLYLDTTNFVGGQPPQVHYYLDDFWARPCEANSVVAEPRRPQSIGYTTSQVNISSREQMGSNGAVCNRFAFRLSQYNSFTNFELQNFFVSWQPEGGV